MDGAWPAVLAVGPVVVAVLGIALLRRRYVVVTVRGPSMEPGLREGDRVLVRRRRAAQLRTGDLVVFAEAPEPPVRPAGAAAPRITGPDRGAESGAGPGPTRPSVPDPIPGRARPSDGWLIKRAVAVAGDPVPHGAGPALATLDDEIVPPDRLVAIGDNAASSYDSRHYGYVTADRLLGVVLRRI
ncbi:S26 family signal peptidase [Plantactinospora sp. CA-294935]|uniref:S26 family signal peptidase n=1 Tax=Plantactinospora sp. CA-294935 TaxID=3240012 RepID=UPI003D9068BE